MCFSVRETHQIAEAQQQKNAKLREAFGISEFFVEGSSLDPQRHVKEAAARAAAEQNKAAGNAAGGATAGSNKYTLVRTPSPSPTVEVLSTKKKKRKAKARYGLLFIISFVYSNCLSVTIFCFLICSY